MSQRKKNIFNSNRKNSNESTNVIYINMPISSMEEDKIGIAQYVDDLKSAIDKGAQSIAVTSDFGGGKSSLIRYLEYSYKYKLKKFCYVNLWSEFKEEGTRNLHKSFIYQLASQINVRKGNYVSKRLSENYGIFTIALPTIWAKVLSFVTFFFLIIGLLCTTLYDVVSNVLTFELLAENHDKIGSAAFCFAVFFALLFLYNSDIVFSAKKATDDREVDEHELMDIYQFYIGRPHLRHYIVVIEDLDRSNNDDVIQFIREFRRYYIPYRKQRRFKIFPNKNRITFIVNIKSEKEIAKQEEKSLYAKAFDYVLDLKEIHIDNYDVILKKLLDENKGLFDESHIPVFDDKGEIKPEFEWLITGKKLDIREIKMRLNTTISTYINLCTKFDRQFISLEKCIAASYIINAYKNEYIKIKTIGFDIIIDLYIQNQKMTEADIINEYKKASRPVSENMLEEQSNTVEISSSFARDIKELICNGMLASDYRQYFFNFPTDSYLHSDKQQRLINIILYDQDVTKEDKFDELVTDVIATDKTIITTTFKRQDKLGVLYSYCIFYSKELFNIAFENNAEKVWATLENKLDYEQQAIATTSRLLLPVIKHHLINNQECMIKLCDILTRKAQVQALVGLRRNIIEAFEQQITSFEALFFGICPLITKTEVDMLKHNEKLLQLINLDSKELNMDLVKTIHASVLSGFDLSEEKIFNEVVLFYEKMYGVLGTIENETLTQYMFDIMRAAKQMHEILENLILKNNSLKYIKDAYAELICMIAEDKSLSEQTLQYILELQIHSGLTPSVCEQLKHRGYYESYIINACSTDISMIDFKLPEIIKGVTSIDYKRKTENDFLHKLLFAIREKILADLSEAELKHYKNLLMHPYEIIRENELYLVEDIKRVLELIDVQQINSDNSLYIAKYFNCQRRTQNESYEILHFICGIKNAKVKKTIFLALDFDFIQYYRISKERREEIVNSMSSVFDFNKFDDQILYMSKTKYSYVPFEKVISIAIKEKTFNNYIEKYVGFIRNARHVTDETIENLCDIDDSYYPMPQRVLDKLYSMKKFEYYVSAKTMEEDVFTFEVDKLNVLDETYKSIFNAGEGDFQYSKKYMADNMNFVAYMCEQKCYENQQTYNRILYVKCAQSVECLQELIRNNSVDFAIEYLSKIESLKNDAAEKYFVDIAKSYLDIAASDEVYKNIYKKLNDSELKRKYTRYHNRAKNIA